MSLTQAFLNGAQRVFIEITYFKPRDIGQDDLEIRPVLLGQKPQRIHHSGILQTFVTQKDDVPDLEDKRLQRVFEEMVLMRNGIINIHDRRIRIAEMTQGAVDFDGKQVAPIIIPTSKEMENPGMIDVTATFKTMVPFPRVRAFLQFWQDQIEGPMHQVRLACGSIANSGFQQKHYIN